MLPYNGRALTARDRLELLAYWINERRLILQRKEAGEPQPWTTDPILGTYRFCNVDREDDTVTKWLAKHWRNSSYSNLTAAMVLARMLNNPPTLNYIGYPHEWDSAAILSSLKTWRDGGHRVLNPAYLITTCGVRMDKLDYIVGVATEVVALNLDNRGGFTLEDFATQLRRVNGLGSFLSAQVAADLKNTPGHPLANASDWWSWAAPGPGSRRGLDHALGQKINEKYFLPMLLEVREGVSPLLQHSKPICAQNFQNCLCEFDKWMRTYLGTSKPKQLYRPSAS